MGTSILNQGRFDWFILTSLAVLLLILQVPPSAAVWRTGQGPNWTLRGGRPEPGPWRDSSSEVLEDDSGVIYWNNDPKFPLDPSEPYAQYDSSIEVPSGAFMDDDDERPFRFDPWWAEERRIIMERMEQEARAEEKERERARAKAEEEFRQQDRRPFVTFKVSVHHVRPKYAAPVRIVMCGNSPELGAWDYQKAVELCATDDSFPIFSVALRLDPDSEIEYVYGVQQVVKESALPAPSQWEVHPRSATTKNKDTTFHDDFLEDRNVPRLTEEAFQLSAQQWSRYFKHRLNVKPPKLRKSDEQ